MVFDSHISASSATCLKEDILHLGERDGLAPPRMFPHIEDPGTVEALTALIYALFLPEKSMKLIFCPSCHDIVRLFRSQRSCKCGDSWGQYTDHIKANVGGLAIPVGVDNKTFARAVRTRGTTPSAHSELNFDAFVFGNPTKNITREGEL